MPNTLSPNMSLILPTVGQEPGPNWALDLNNSLSTVDQHNHSPGSGVQITPAGMNINTDLSFGSNNATNLRSLRISSQSLPLSLGADVNCIYVTNGNLYYNDNVGNQIQITASGAVNGTPGSIGNLIAPAAVTYVPANQTYVFQSNQGNSTPGAIDSGPLYLRNITPSSNYVLIQPNAVLPANYSITLPSAPPVSQALVEMSSTGVLSASVGSYQALNPVGTVLMFAGNAAPSGYLLCDGSTLNSVANPQYAALFAIIGTTYGGTGAASFKLPDCRGIFVRGAGSQTISGVSYTSGTIGVPQGDQFQGHYHSADVISGSVNWSDTLGAVAPFSNPSGAFSTGGANLERPVRSSTTGLFPATLSFSATPSIKDASTGTNGSPRTGNETRPANLAMNYIIKF